MFRKLKLLCSKVCQRHTECTKRRVENPHEGVVESLRVHLAGLELERSIVTSHVPRQANEHLAQRRMNIEVELALKVVRSELAKAAQYNASAALDL